MNIKQKERAAPASFAAPSSNKATKFVSSIITPSVFLVSETNLHKFNTDLRLAIETYTKNNDYELENINFSTAALPENENMIARVEYSALLLFRRIRK